MKSTIAVVVLLLLAPATGSGATASAQDGASAAVAPATTAAPEATKHPTDAPLRQRSRGTMIILVALFGVLAGAGILVARTGRREPDAA